MNIQGFQKLTLLDFPGKVACTVFTGGCNLRCPFCHNASLVCSPTEYPNAEKEVLEYLSRRSGILDGICITGGEPLLQPDLEDFMRKVRDMGYLIKLDTNGSMPDKLSDIIGTGLVDYVAMDVKNSLGNYFKAVGLDCDVSLFERSAAILMQSGIEHEFRTTAVKNIHTAEDFEEIGKWLAGCSRYYIQGFVDSGNVLEDGYDSFTPEQMRTFLETVQKYIPGAQLRGQG